MLGDSRFGQAIGTRDGTMTTGVQGSDFGRFLCKVPTATRHPDQRVADFLTMMLLLLALSVSGCAAFRPLRGIPAKNMPDEMRLPSRSGKSTIDLSLLRQTPPREYQCDSGDVLGIYIEGVLGGKGEIPPVNFRQNGATRSAVGYPMTIREDGSIALPMIGALDVRGMTIRKVENAVRKAYTKDHPILKPGQDRILVSLHQRRSYDILVIRQESGSRTAISSGLSAPGSNTVKFGTGRVVTLPAYRNDVLNALAETGGLPGLDAQNAIYIIRRNQVGPHTLRRVSSRRFAKGRPKALARSRSRASRVAARHVFRARRSKPSGANRSGIRPIVFRAQSPQRSIIPVLPSGAGSWGHTPPPPLAPAQEETTPRIPTGPRLSRSDTGTPPNPTPAVNRAVPTRLPATTLPSSRPTGIDGSTFPATEQPFPVAVDDATIGNSNVIRIPLRMFPGEMANFSEEDIILHDGDIVFIESRRTDFFYTGGLLGNGQYALPRDYDIDVLSCLAIAQSGSSNPGNNGNSRAVGGVSALNHDVTVGASRLIIVRRQPDGSTLPIQVDLYKAVLHPEQRILIKPGDYVVLQYTHVEAVGAFVQRFVLDGFILGIASGLAFGGN